MNDPIFPWTPSDILDFDPSNHFRSKRANFVLPSFNEWHKSAYFLPSVNAYSDYVNSFSQPTPVANGTSPNTAVFFQGAPADVNLAGGLSPYGVMGLLGNVAELTETEFDLVNDFSSNVRLARGGYWADPPTTGIWNNSQQVFPTGESTSIGFRVVSLAAVPEPSSTLLVGLSLMASVLCLRRRKSGYNKA